MILSSCWIAAAWSRRQHQQEQEDPDCHVKKDGSEQVDHRGNHGGSGSGDSGDPVL